MPPSPPPRRLYSGGEDSLSSSEIETTMGVSAFVSILSLLGSVFILLCYLRFAHLRKFSFTLVALLSLSDVLNQLFDFAQSTPDELAYMERTGSVTPTCYVQAIGNSVFELASVLWTTAIAMTLYLFIFLRVQPERVERRLPLMALVCFGLPLVLALLPLADDAYGPSGAWCWVRTGTSARLAAWQFGIFYGPLWVAILFNAFVYLRTWRLLRRMLSAAGPEAEHDATLVRLTAVMTRLQLYPFILLIVWTFASINRIYEAASGGASPVFALYFLQRAFSSSQGLLNALAYGFSNGVRESLRDELARCCPGIVSKAPDPLDANVGAAGRRGDGEESGNLDMAGGPATGHAAAAAGGAALWGGTAGLLATGGAAGLGGRRDESSGRRLHGGAGDDGDDADVDDTDVRVLVPPTAAAAAVAAAAVPASASASSSAATVVRNPVQAAAGAAGASPAGPRGVGGAVSRLERVKGMGSVGGELL
jgi:cAMP receptor-like G-protein coupled receptor